MGTPAIQPGWRLRAVLCAVALAAYANSFGLGFALDGRRMVMGDARVHAATAENLRLILTHDYWWPTFVDRLYRPLTTASFLFNYAILGNGQSAAGYHVLNFLLHALNVLLVFELARRVLGRAAPAFFAAALWAVHPAGSEAVANVAGRADLLATAAVLGGLLLYARLAESQGPVLLYAGAIFMVSLAGLFSKESAAVLIGMMALWDMAFAPGGREGLRRRLPVYGAVVLGVTIMLLARQSVLGASPWPDEPFLDNPLRGAGWVAARLTAIKVLGHYLWLLAVPWTLRFDYSYNQVPVSGPGDSAAWAGLLLAAGIVAAAIVRRKKDPALFWAAGFFAIAILPVSNLVVTIGSIMALRFLYLPSIGFAVAVTALVLRLKNEKAARAVLAALVVLFAARTLARNPAWASDGALAAADVENGTRSSRAHLLLGESLSAEDPRGNLDRAIAELEQAWAIIEPLPAAAGSQQVAAELGKLYRQKGGQEGGAAGRAWYEKSAAILERGAAILDAQWAAFDRAQREHGRPPTPHGGNEGVLLGLGRSYAALGRHAEAAAAYRKGRNMSPGETTFFDALATAYAAQGKLEAAAIAIDEKAYVFGLSPATLASIRNLYSRIPGGECALDAAGGATKLNLGCPKLREHMCIGWAHLAIAYDRAHLAGKALSVRNEAIQGAGCRADLFAANAVVPML